MYLQELGAFKGMFSLHCKDNVNSYQVLPRYAVYILQETLKKEMESLLEL